MLKYTIQENPSNKEMGYQSQDNRVTSLNLSNCDLPFIPSNIQVLSQLKVFNLSDNGLKKLPLSICDIPNLENLNLSGNKIEALPNDIHKLRYLKILDLRRNNITSLPEGIFSLREIHTILLKDNPLEIPLLTNIINNPNQVRHLLSHFAGPLRKAS